MATTQFVIDSYNNLLIREPSVSEILSLRENSEETLLGIIIDSTEAEVKVAAITRLYYAYFDRVPDIEGLKYWRAFLVSGEQTITDIAQAFTNSAEFIDQYGDVSDLVFVTRVYNNTLLREPDDGGLQYWTDKLSNGLSRGSMMVGFSESTEFTANQAHKVDAVLSSVTINDAIPSNDIINTRAATALQSSILQFALNDRALTVSASGSTLTISNKPTDEAGISLNIGESTLTDGAVDITPTGTTISAISIVSAGNLSGVLTATAGTKAISITSGSGADVIVGSAKDDTISTGSGADTITAGVGGDKITGGDGADKFILVAGDSGVVAIAGTLATQSATITYVADALDTVTVNGVAISYSAATDDTTTATAISTAINANSQVKDIVSAANAANVITVTSDILGTPISVTFTGTGTGHTAGATTSSAATARIISSIDSISDLNAGGDGISIVDQINLGGAISSIVSGSIAAPTAIGASALPDGSAQTVTTAIEDLFRFGGALTSTSVSDTIAGVFSFESKIYLITNAAPNTATTSTTSPFDDTADFIIDITGATGTLDTGDFISA